MLYGYGDDRNPYTETVDFLEDLVFQFITDMTQKAMEIGRQNRVQVGNPDTSQYFLYKFFFWALAFIRTTLLITMYSI